MLKAPFGWASPHRGLIVRSHDLVVIGGMEKGQQVTAKVVVVEKEKKK